MPAADVCPASHWSQDKELGADSVRAHPTGHSTHPAPKRPAPQREQLTDPFSVALKPVGHDVQLDAPGVSENVSGAQELHPTETSVDARNLPAPHVVHRAAPYSDVRPMSQPSHVVAFCSAENVLSEQERHFVCAV
jgi:hypothetical protein